MMSKLAGFLVGALACALTFPAAATQRTGACGDKFVAPAASSLALVSGDDGTLISPANATGPADGWAAASLPVSLPSVASLSGNPWTVCGTSENNAAVIFIAPLLAVPAVPVLSQTAGGSLSARTYFVAVTYTNLTGETTVSAEATMAVGANNRLVVAGPASSGDATGWNLYVGTLTGNKTKQNASPMVLGVNFTEPLGGLISGATPPTGNTASSAYILDGGRVLNRYLVGGTNYQTATLSTDGANYRVIDASNETRMIAGATTGFPARYGFPGGPGYQTTQGDNGTAITSGATSGGLTVTLPSTTDIAAGWTVRFDRDAGKDMTVNTNVTSGGSIAFPGGTSTSVVLAPYNRESLLLQYDGAVFRALQISTATATILGVSGDLGHVKNLAGLKLIKGTPDSAIFRDGFLTAGDGGLAKYNWSATNCAAADDGAQVQPTAITGCWIADFTSPPSVKVWGAKGDCTNDDAPALQAALNTKQQILLPQGDFLLGSAITLTSAAQLVGQGWSLLGLEQANTPTACSTYEGSYITIKNTSIRPFTLATNVASGIRFSNFGILQLHSAPGGGWTPTSYQPVFTLDGTTAGNLPDIFFDHLGLGGIYQFVNQIGNAARIDFRVIKGQTFSYFFQTDTSFDISSADDIQDNANYWSNNTNVVDWQQAHSIGFFFHRQDSFQADKVFMFGKKACVELSEASGSPGGFATAIHFGGLNCDAALYGVLVDSSSLGSSLAIDHFWFGGEGTAAGFTIPLSGGSPIQIDGHNATFDIGDMNITAACCAAVTFTNATDGAIVRIGSITALGGMNYSGCPSACVAFTGSYQVFNFAPSTNTAEISVLHPIQPQLAGTSVNNAGVYETSGLINYDSNAIVYEKRQSWIALVPTNGGSFTTPNWAETVLLTNGVTIASATIALPPNTLDGREITYTCENTITTLTFTSAMPITNSPTACAPGSSFTFKFFRALAGTWAQGH